MWGSMKQEICYKALVISLVVTSFLHGAQAKPSTWQKFKNVFSSKKPALNQSIDQDKISDKPGFVQSITNVYKESTKFSKFSKDQTKMIEVKIKTLEAVQERINKISKEPGFFAKLFWKEKSPSPEIEEEKVRLAEQIGRLRADLFMTFVEIFQEIKPVLQAIQTMMKRGLFKDTKIFDTMIQNCGDLVTQGNDITEKLLRASNGYSKTILVVDNKGKYTIDDINKESELLINNYFKSAVKVMSAIEPAITVLKGVVNTLKNMAWLANTLSLGSITSLAAALILVDKMLGAGKIAADLSKDIFNQVVEKGNLKVIQSKVASLEKDILKTSKTIENDAKNLEKNKQAFDEHQDELTVEDLKRIKNN